MMGTYSVTAKDENGCISSPSDMIIGTASRLLSSFIHYSILYLCCNIIAELGHLYNTNDEITFDVYNWH